MSWTHQKAVLNLLSYVGIYGFTEAQNVNEVEGEDDTDIDWAIGALNAGLQEFYRKGPKAIKHGNRSTYLNPPTDITLTIAAGVVTTASQAPAWMIGCSVRIEGDETLNRITAISATGLTLFATYLGPDGAHTATVYADAIKLSSTVAAILDPVQVYGSHRLRPADGRSDFEHLGGNGSYRYIDDVLGYGAGVNFPAFALSRKQTGAPQVYLVEQAMGSLGSLYLNLNPMPTKADNLVYDVYLRPEKVERDVSIDEEGGDDPEIEFSSVPDDMIDSILLPIARWFFFQHPNLKNTEMRRAIDTGRQEALLSLSNNTFNPKVAPVRVRYL